MKSTATFPMPSRVNSLRTLLAGAVAVAVGAALFLHRGPDLSVLPKMTELAIATTQGHHLFVQTHEVSVAEWNRCHAAGACTLALPDPARADGRSFPATGLSWVDVNEYLNWINQTTRHPFRLPTSEEWYALAQDVLPEKPDPIFTDPELSWASAYLTAPQTSRALRPSGSFATTKAGVSDLNGNVWEWTQDCYDRAGDPVSDKNCPAYVVGGEHEAVIPYLVRDPARGGCAVGAPPAHLGMRLVTERPLPNARS